MLHGQRAQTGRADLLRSLHAGVDRPLALLHEDEFWWGYQKRPDPPTPALFVDVDLTESAVQVPAAHAAPTARRQPLRMPYVFTVLSPETTEPGNSESAALNVAPLGAADLCAPGTAPVGYQHLVPWARLNPVLRRHLSRSVSGELDVPGLVKALSRQRLPQRLPRRAHQRWATDLVVALDFSARLYPYRADQHQLALQLARQVGRTGLGLRILDDGPLGPCTPWREHIEPERVDEPQTWQMPPPGGTLLIVGDLGLLAQDDGALHRHWMAWVTSAQACGVQVLALAPLGPEQLPAECCQTLPLLRWSPDSRFRVESGTRNPGTQPDALAQLLALIAPVQRVDPPLLRLLRQQVPAAPLHAGLEGAVWAHADVAAGQNCHLQPAAALVHQQRFASLASTLQTAQRAARLIQHQHLRPALGVGEELQWAASAAQHPQAEAVAEAAMLFVRSLIAALSSASAADGAISAELAAVADHLLAQQGTVAPARFQGVWDELRELRLRGSGPVPQAGELAAVRCDLVLKGNELGLQIGAEDSDSQVATGLGASTSLGEVMIPQGRLLVRGNGPDHWLFVTGAESFVPLANLRSAPPQELELIWPGGRHLIQRQQRPGWAPGWQQGDGGVEVTVPTPVGASFAVKLEDVNGFGRLPHAPMGGSGDAEVGVDQYGIYLELELSFHTKRRRSKIAAISQIFRYIPPATFLMGSPADVGHVYEYPQHPVTISQGYWLADTPCTQALWLAVMAGRNPSYFSQAVDAAQRPVESVSWDEVQSFLARLDKFLPTGCVTELPSEAEWELACRSGTQTDFAWGDQRDPTRANMHTRETTTVKQYKPNQWGLYDMHGNVWEWCADGPRIYSARVEIDPCGATEGAAQRVLRGGSWRHGADCARSAYRDWYATSRPVRARGFRFLLRAHSPDVQSARRQPGIGTRGSSAPVAAGGGVTPAAEPTGSALESQSLLNKAAEVLQRLRSKPPGRK